MKTLAKIILVSTLIAILTVGLAVAIVTAGGPELGTVIIKPTLPCSLCDNYTTPIPRWDCIHCDIR